MVPESVAPKRLIPIGEENACCSRDGNPSDLDTITKLQFILAGHPLAVAPEEQIVADQCHYVNRKRSRSEFARRTRALHLTGGMMIFGDISPCSRPQVNAAAAPPQPPRGIRDDIRRVVLSAECSGLGSSAVRRVAVRRQARPAARSVMRRYDAGAPLYSLAGGREEAAGRHLGVGRRVARCPAAPERPRRDGLVYDAARSVTVLFGGGAARSPTATLGVGRPAGPSRRSKATRRRHGTCPGYDASGTGRAVRRRVRTRRRRPVRGHVGIRRPGLDPCREQGRRPAAPRHDVRRRPEARAAVRRYRATVHVGHLGVGRQGVEAGGETDGPLLAASGRGWPTTIRRRTVLVGGFVEHRPVEWDGEAWRNVPAASCRTRRGRRRTANAVASTARSGCYGVGERGRRYGLDGRVGQAVGLSRSASGRATAEFQTRTARVRALGTDGGRSPSPSWTSADRLDGRRGHSSDEVRRPTAETDRAAILVLRVQCFQGGPGGLAWSFAERGTDAEVKSVFLDFVDRS